MSFFNNTSPFPIRQQVGCLNGCAEIVVFYNQEQLDEYNRQAMVECYKRTGKPYQHLLREDDIPY